MSRAKEMRIVQARRRRRRRRRWLQAATPAKWRVMNMLTCAESYEQERFVLGISGSSTFRAVRQAENARVRDKNDTQRERKKERRDRFREGKGHCPIFRHISALAINDARTRVRERERKEEKKKKKSSKQHRGNTR